MSNKRNKRVRELQGAERAASQPAGVVPEVTAAKLQYDVFDISIGGHFLGLRLSELVVEIFATHLASFFADHWPTTTPPAADHHPECAWSPGNDECCSCAGRGPVAPPSVTSPLTREEAHQEANDWYMRETGETYELRSLEVLRRICSLADLLLRVAADARRVALEEVAQECERIGKLWDVEIGMRAMTLSQVMPELAAKWRATSPSRLRRRCKVIEMHDCPSCGTERIRTTVRVCGACEISERYEKRIANLEHERDGYRSALADLVAATKGADLGQSPIYYRHRAIDVLKNGPKPAPAEEGGET